VPGLPNGTRIYGTKGQIVLGRPPQVFLAEARPDLDLVANEWQEIKLAEGAARGERSQIVEQFARAVQEHRQPPVTGEDGRAALEVIVAAYRAGEAGQPISLPLAK
jgi:myo-inositol 2-dehydrogenase/D-chiro-inositol 1-dehydrogenase